MRLVPLTLINKAQIKLFLRLDAYIIKVNKKHRGKLNGVARQRK